MVCLAQSIRVRVRVRVRCDLQLRQANHLRVHLPGWRQWEQAAAGARLVPVRRWMAHQHLAQVRRRSWPRLEVWRPVLQQEAVQVQVRVQVPQQE